ncbi:hypothetical protein [Parapontixanthobacter aurantiacus]|uniref:hypothetical protein n=1 Tax=Parapontixanthobacter aurantiacus TaxID=1463599 RepID=UPI001925EA07|nr:hypothetical protein [Parapontixanthobacter aurantiacus]
MADEGRRRSARSKTRMTKAILAEEGGAELSKHWRKDFLTALAETSNVTRSAKIAGVAPGRAYKVRREEPEFRRQWFDALCEGYDHLEMEVLRRLRDGDFATAEGGKFDFASALRVLGAHRESVGQEKASRANLDEEAVLGSITAKIEALRLAHRKKESGILIEGMVRPAAASPKDKRK